MRIFGGNDLVVNFHDDVDVEVDVEDMFGRSPLIDIVGRDLLISCQIYVR